jgi:NADH:ubiquinone oxidoreductase subunit 3 (subunit A)
MRLFLDFVPVLVWAILGVVLVIVMLLASWVLRPHVLQNSEKTSTYECGEEPIGPARISYPYNYLAYTILFVVVDVLGAFLWLLSPWFNDLVTADVPEYAIAQNIALQALVFVIIVMAGIWYVMKSMSQISLDGKETVELYRETIAAKEHEHKQSGGH